MLALTLVQKLYEGAIKFHNFMNAPHDPQKIRDSLARQAIRSLNEDGGNRLHVKGVFYAATKVVPVSIVYSVPLDPHDEFANISDCIGQHIIYNVETSSWENLMRDLQILSDHFLAAHLRTYPTLPDYKISREFNSHLAYVERAVARERAGIVPK